MNRTTVLALIGALIGPPAGAHTINLAADTLDVTQSAVPAQTAITPTAPVDRIGNTPRSATGQTLMARQRAHANALRADLRARAAAHINALRAQHDATLKAINPAAFARITQHRARIEARRTAMAQRAAARRQLIEMRQSDTRPAPAGYSASAPRPRWQRRTDW